MSGGAWHDADPATFPFPAGPASSRLPAGMLLIDPGRIVLSLRPDEAPFPYARRDFRGQPARAGRFLAQAAGVERWLPVLTRELAQLADVQRLRASLPAMLLAEAARALARGAIVVGQRIPEDAAVRWRGAEDVPPGVAEEVRFAGEAVAKRALDRWLLDPDSRAAVESARRDPRMAEWAVPAGDSEAASWLALGLATRRLALVVLGEDTGALRLVRVEHRLPTRREAEEAALPAGPPALDRIVQAVRTTLPSLPADISAQAQTLLDAARNGVPFCEECARAAAGLLGV